MKIVHVVSGDLGGGAARGAYWLHKGLRELGVDSIILTNAEDTWGDKSIYSIAVSKKEKILNFFRGESDSLIQTPYWKRKKLIFSTGLCGFDFRNLKVFKEAEIIHLHWINHGLTNIRHLKKIKKPIVWTMRDMWPMTGGCHYALTCDHYIYGCGKCPQLNSRLEYDLSRLIFKRKQHYIPPNTKLVGISRWLSDCARKSALFHDYDIRTIHNNINTRKFFPVPKPIARQMVGLPLEKPVLLVGAQHVNDFYKGFDIYLRAIPKLDSKPLLLFFGNLSDALIEPFKLDFMNLGFLHDTISLRLAYSAADLFVAPSRMDAFGKTLAEAMACGTPVVCFDATGPGDIVDHMKNGYKATPFEPEDLARGIEWVLGHPEPEVLSRNAREKVLRNFDHLVVAMKHIELYREILTESTPAYI